MPVFIAQGAPALKCPGCSTQVEDGTSICPKCDYIIDSSFLSAEPPAGGDDDESTGAAEDPRKAAPARPARSGTTGSRPAARGTTGSTRRVGTGQTGPRPAVGARPGGSKPAVRAVSKSARAVPPRPAAAPPDHGSDMELDDADLRKPIPPPARPSPHTTNSGIVAPEEVISDARAFISDLGRSDKIAFAGCVTIILSCFIPWRETATDGEILGLMSMGVGALLGAALIIGAIAIRVRRTMPKLNPLLPWVMQLGLSLFCIIYTVIAIQLSFDSTQVPAAEGNAMVRNSSPSFGAFLSLLGGLGALAGSLLGMKERA
jgi:hypothetical protein